MDSAAFPERDFRQRVLEFAFGFADDEGHGLRLAQQVEVRGEQGFQAVQRGEVFAILLEAADSGFALGVFGQPGVGRGEDEQAAGVEALVDGFEEQRRVVEAVDQVGGEDEVVAGEDGL